MKKIKGIVLSAIVVIIFLFWGSLSYGNDFSIIKEYSGTITGTLEYTRMQYFFHTAKGEAYSINYDEDTQWDELQKYAGQEVKLTGIIYVYKNGRKCINIRGSLPDSLPTVAGQLNIGKQDVKRSWGMTEAPVVKLNGKTIYIGEGGFSLHFCRLFDFGSYQSVLVIDNTGGTGCPVSYVFITLRSNKTYSVTKSFGNCSDIPEIGRQYSKVTLKFPPFGGASAVKWVYDNGNISKTK